MKLSQIGGQNPFFQLDFFLTSPKQSSTMRQHLELIELWAILVLFCVLWNVGNTDAACLNCQTSFLMVALVSAADLLVLQMLWMQSWNMCAKYSKLQTSESSETRWRFEPTLTSSGFHHFLFQTQPHFTVKNLLAQNRRLAENCRQLRK